MNKQIEFEVGKKYVKDRHPFLQSYVEISRIESDRVFGRMYVQDKSYFDGKVFSLLDKDDEKMWLKDLHEWRPFLEN